MTTKWFTKRAEHEYGPYSWEQLVEYAREGRVLEDDQVKSEEMQHWIKASEQTGLFASAPLQTPANSTSGNEAQQPKPKRSALKTIGLVVGGLLAVVGLIFIILVVMNFKLPLEISNIVLSDEPMAEDIADIKPTDSFGSFTEEIYLTMKVANIKDDSYIEAFWYYEDDDLLITNSKLELKPGRDIAEFSLSTTVEWPVGSYRADLVISESEGIAETVRFTIFKEKLSMEERFPDKNIYRGADFALAYPSDWIYHTVGNIVYIRGPEGTEAYDAYLTTQSIAAEYPDDDFRDIEKIIDFHIADLSQYDAIIDVGEEKLEGLFGDEVLTVMHIAAGYTFEELDLIEWIALIKRNGPKVQEFIFTIPNEIHSDEYMAIFFEIFNSLTFYDD